jgi:disulfide bond formation protein DsbB
MLGLFFKIFIKKTQYCFRSCVRFLLKNILSIAVFLSFCSVCFSFAIEKIFHLIPCYLCLAERFILVLFILVYFALKIGFSYKKLLIGSILIFFVGFGVSFYHLLIELRLLNTSCLLNFANFVNTVSCETSGFEFLGLSLIKIVFLFYLCFLCLFLIRLRSIYIKSN